MKRITKFTAILMAVLLLGTCNLQYSVPAADISQAEISQAEIPQAEIPQAESPDFVTEDTEEDAVEEDSGTEESGVSIPGAGEESSDEGDFGREGTEEDDLLNEGTETRQEEESVSSDLEDPAGEQGSISPDREDSAGEQGSISSDREDSAVEEESVGSDLEDPAGGEESRDDENESGTVVKEEEVNDNGAIEEEQSGNELVSENACSAAGSLPVIALDYVPASGVVSPLQGQVYMEDGSDFNPSAYRISLFIQINDGETCWAKPTYDKPYVDIGKDGFFSGVFCTGSNDENASIIHVLLVPSDYVPNNFSETKGKAIDYVKIVRTKDGSVTVTPNRQAPEKPDAAPAITALLPVKENRIAVDVGFYTDGSSPGSKLSESQIRQQLTAVTKFADTVRFYSAGGEINKAYRIAHEMGLSVVGTAYLCGKTSDDRAEMDALIGLCKKGYVQVACVGNETLLENQFIKPKLTAEQLIGDINYVRKGISGAGGGIPVTTSDSVDVLLSNASVRNACSLIMPNCYPFWGGADNTSAVKGFTQSITALQAVCGNKQVLVSETGWPTAGGTEGSAAAGETQAARYFEAVRKWSLETNTQVLFFQAADEPWKTESGFGPHWGFMTNRFELKGGYAKTSFFSGLGISAGCIHDIIKDAAVAPTCTKSGLTEGSHCSICKKIFKSQATVRAKGHNWGSWTTVKKATTTQEGLERRVCKNDSSHYETRKIEKLQPSKTAQNVKVKISASRIAVGKKAVITVTGNKGKISFKSSVPASASVSSAGEVTAKKIGTVKITVSAAATAKYLAASKTVTVKVVPAATKNVTSVNTAAGVRLSWKKVTGATGYIVYCGNRKAAQIKKGSTVTFTDKKAKTNGKKYTYKVIAKASTGNSTLSKSLTTLYLSNPSLKSLKKAAAKKIKINWTENKKADGYRIQYSTDSGFRKNNLSTTVKKAVNVTAVIGNLKKGKTYYVRIRAYKTMGKKTYSSAWSASRSIKIN